jgi:alpha-tubulin suppressor-like RCC1 family protein
LTNVIAITALQYDTCALLAAGTVKCWGDNFYGQVGDNTVTERHVPTAVSSLTGVTAITGGAYHVCALLATGTEKCWGLNSNGQIGDGTQIGRHVAKAVTGLTNLSAVANGDYTSCALLAAGTVKCWGANDQGQIGDGTTTQRLLPMAIGGAVTGVATITAGTAHACARGAGGGLRCWGDNSQGQLGDNTVTDKHTPTVIGSLTGLVFAIAAGQYHTCALLGTGTLRCWGDNAHGQIGDGTVTDRHLPHTVTGL